PRSVMPLTKRSRPRWSVLTPVGIRVLSPASMAWEPSSRAWVQVGPPLSFSSPSLGLPRSQPGRPEPSSTRLLLPERRPWLTMSLPFGLLATMLLFSVRLPERLETPPPIGAELPDRVQLTRVSVPSLQTPPPESQLELPDRVQSTSVLDPEK